MARTWLNDGKPDTSGRLCLEIDPEDGTQPLRIWGRSKEEILDKASRTVEHGQREITRLRSTPPAPSGKPNGHGTPQTPPPEQKPQLTPDERMQLTADLNNPAKAANAITRLVEDETGIDFTGIKNQETVKRVAAIQAAWSLNRPDFPNNPINYKLLNDTAALRVGYENITAAVMDQVFQELSSAGMLLPAIDDDAPIAQSVQPAETPATRTVRPRGAASYSRARLASPAPAAASPTPKYTREQIEGMSSAEYRRKLETDPEFLIAVNALNASKTPPVQA